MKKIIIILIISITLILFFACSCKSEPKYTAEEWKKIQQEQKINSGSSRFTVVIQVTITC